MWPLFYYRIDFENAINQTFFQGKKYYSLEFYFKQAQTCYPYFVILRIQYIYV